MTNTINNKKIIFLANDFSKNLINYANNHSNIHLLNSYDTFKVMQYFNCYPELKNTQTREKKTLKTLLNSFITTKNAKAFFKSALALLLFSFFTFYKIYYRTIGFLLFVLGIISLKQKPTETTNDLSLDKII